MCLCSVVLLQFVYFVISYKEAMTYIILSKPNPSVFSINRVGVVYTYKNVLRLKRCLDTPIETRSLGYVYVI